MAAYLLTPPALADIESITDWSLAKWGEAKTGEYLDALYARFDWLAENPKLGRARDEIGPGYRSFPEGTHVIFYELGDDGIMITGVPHASMDFGAHFN